MYFSELWCLLESCIDLKTMSISSHEQISGNIDYFLGVKIDVSFKPIFPVKQQKFLKAFLSL